MRYNKPVLLTHGRGAGYLTMAVAKSNKPESMGRVIWEAIKGKIPRGFVVDHINNNRLDNRIENLQLLTPRENTQRASRGGVFKRGEGRYLARRDINGYRPAKTFKTRCGANMFVNTVHLKSKYQRSK